MTTIERKTFFSALDLKDSATGEVAATVATLGVVDKQGDIIRPGAVKDGAKVVMSSYAHNVVTDNAEPVGRGVLKTVGNRLQFEGRLFLTTERGRTTHEILKAMAELQQWSFAFRTTREDVLTSTERQAGAVRALALIHPVEVAPVFEGAGIGTQTLAVKAAQAAVEAVDAVEAAWLEDLRNRYLLPLELRALRENAEGILEQSDLHQLVLRSLDRELTRPDSYAPAPEFGKVVDFARAELGLDWRALPEPRLVRAGTLKGTEGQRTRGRFGVTNGRPRIFLEDTGDFAGMTHTFFHEASHARQKFYGDAMTERDACQGADRLVVAWNADRS